MFTDAKHLAAWWGPHGWTNPVCEADPRPGGKILIHMQAPDGSAHPMGGVFHEIVPHERIVFTTFVDMPDGKRVIEVAQHRAVRGEGGKTKVILQRAPAASPISRANMLAGMEAGWSQSLDKLAGVAAQPERQRGRRRSGRDPRDLRRPHQCAVRQGRGSRGQAFRRRRRVLRSRSAAAARRHRQGRAAEMVRHLGRPDRLGDGRSRGRESAAISRSRTGSAT